MGDEVGTVARFVAVLLALQCLSLPPVHGKEKRTKPSLPSNQAPPMVSPSSISTNELCKKLHAELKRFNRYLWNIGDLNDTVTPDLILVDQLPKKVGEWWGSRDVSEDEDGFFVFDSYRSTAYKLIVRKEYAAVPGNVLKFYTRHAVLIHYVNHYIDGPYNSASFLAVYSALSDYFPRSFLGVNPDNSDAQWPSAVATLSPVTDPDIRKKIDKSGVPFANLLWLLRCEIGAKTLDHILFRTWAEAQVDYHSRHFETAFSQRLVKLLGRDGDKAKALLASHGIQGLPTENN